MSTEQYDIGIAAAAVHVCDVARVCVCARILICLFYSLSPLVGSTQSTHRDTTRVQAAGDSWQEKRPQKIWARKKEREPCVPLERVSSQRQHDA